MPTFTLIRHAKAEVGDDALPDRERALNARGRGDAEALGEALTRAGHRAGLVLVSSAVRTCETWDLISAHAPADRIDVRDDLYMAGPDAILGAAARGLGQTDAVWIIGHNPGLWEVAYAATRTPGDHDRVGVERLSRGFPTAHAAVFAVEDGDPSAAPRLALWVSPG